MMKKRNLLLIFTMVTASSLCLFTSCMQGSGSQSTPQNSSSSYSSDSSDGSDSALQEERSPMIDRRDMPFDENDDMPMPMPRQHFRHMPPPQRSEENGELPPPMPENHDENNEISDSSERHCSDGSCDSESGSHAHHNRHHKHYKKSGN
jgi:hypothetical protein